MTTGDRIKALRIKHDMSQEELGEKLGVQKAAIHKYENGIIVNLKRSTIAKLAKILNTTPAYLLCLDENEKPATKYNGDGMSGLDVRIMEGFQELSPERKRLLIAQIEAWLSIE